MDCKQVEDLLPLYVARDLDARRERLVTAHVQVCAGCNSAADEYREARQLLQEFRPRVFNESVYAEIRQRVWREIEAKPAAPSMSEVIAGWFRPRVTWAVATALLIAVSVFGIYFIANRNTVRQEVAVNSPEINRSVPNHETGGRPSRDTSTASASASHEGMKGKRQVYIRRPGRRGDRKVAPGRVNPLVASAPDAPPTTAAPPKLSNSAELDSSSAGDSGKTLRMEIQTKDPNIRIIWFSNPDTKRVSPSSKGI